MAVIAAVDSGLIPKGGGHAMAAGVTIRPGQLGAFRAHLYEVLETTAAIARTETALEIDAALTARGANVDLRLPDDGDGHRGRRGLGLELHGQP